MIFTSEGDVRQAVNNLQSTFYGFEFISAENVFKVCDQPHPVVIQHMIEATMKSDVDKSMQIVLSLLNQGYSAMDIISTIFKVMKVYNDCSESTKMAYIKVGFYNYI